MMTSDSPAAGATQASPLHIGGDKHTSVCL